MKVVMELDKDFKKGQQWNKKGMAIFGHQEFNDEDAVVFNIYDELEGARVAQFEMFLNPTMVVGEITRMHIFDKNVNRIQLIKEFLNYIYTIQKEFKVLVLEINIRESGFEDFELQCVGFYTDSFGYIWYHLNSNYEEVINIGTNDEELKGKLKEKISRVCLKKEKYILEIQKQLEATRRDLEEMEITGNMRFADIKRQKIEEYEIILNHLDENQNLSR